MKRFSMWVGVDFAAQWPLNRDRVVGAREAMTAVAVRCPFRPERPAACQSLHRTSFGVIMGVSVALSENYRTRTVIRPSSPSPSNGGVCTCVLWGDDEASAS